MGIGRDVAALKRIQEGLLARRVPVNIVCSTSYYVAATHPEDMDARTVGDIAGALRWMPVCVVSDLNEWQGFFVKEIVEGIEDTGVRAGIIGEIGAFHRYALAQKT